MGANEQKPANPIPKDGFPRNRQQKKVCGKWMRIGAVVPVGNKDDWWSLEKEFGVPPWDIVYANFETYNPEETNWYLREYVGCHRLSPNRANYTFRDSKPGLILSPFPEAALAIAMERMCRPKPEQTEIEKRWPEIKKDIEKGKKLVHRETERGFFVVSEQEWNALAFDPRDELKPSKIWKKGKKAYKNPEGAMRGLPWEAIKAYLKETSSEQQELRRRRQGLYEAYTSGFIQALFPKFKVDVEDMTAGERLAYARGQSNGRSLTPRQRYQFMVGLIESHRVHGMSGFNPIPRSVHYFESHSNASRLQSAFEERFIWMKYRFRNARSKGQREANP